MHFGCGTDLKLGEHAVEGLALGLGPGYGGDLEVVEAPEHEQGDAHGKERSGDDSPAEEEASLVEVGADEAEVAGEPGRGADAHAVVDVEDGDGDDGVEREEEDEEAAVEAGLQAAELRGPELGLAGVHGPGDEHWERQQQDEDRRRDGVEEELGEPIPLAAEAGDGGDDEDVSLDDGAVPEEL